MGRPLRRAVTAAGILIGVFVLLGIGFNLIFRTISYSFYKSAQEYSPKAGDIERLEIGDGLVGYLHRAEGDSPTVLYFGGSGEIAYNAVHDYREVFEGCTLAAVDYPGTQESGGKMNLASMQEAALALYDHLVEEGDVEPDKVYVAGYSYGTGMAAYLAARRECAGLVLVAPYRDVKDLYNGVIPVFHSPLGWFVTNNIETAEYAKEVEAPALIVTSDGDTTLKADLAYSLAEAFGNAEVFQAEGVDHTDYWTDGDVLDKVAEFLGK